ncbi:MAG TPA: lysophospholipid acyltransferase family protein [Gemmatimonas sp.]|nr:lysophospholipid acyltransferase family protein [Gemmatimonas sp.]
MSDAQPVTAPPAAPATKSPTLSHRLEYYGTRGMVGGLRLLPWRVASSIGASIATLAYRPFGIRRGVTERQIAAAFPEYSPEEVADTARRSYESLGRTSIETAVLPGTPRAELIRRFELVEGWDLLEAARAEGKGVIIVTGHLGNWEYGGAYVAARGMPFDAVTRGMANPLFDAYIRRTRADIGFEVIHDAEAVRRTPRALKEGRVIAMVCDQDGLNLASTFVPFFGRPAKTPRGPAVFALRLGVPLIFAASVRRPSGNYALLLTRLPVVQSGDRDADVDAIVLAYTQRLESYVRQYPEQYFWQHRRWRRQPPDTPAHLREP